MDRLPNGSERNTYRGAVVKSAKEGVVFLWTVRLAHGMPVALVIPLFLLLTLLFKTTDFKFTF